METCLEAQARGNFTDSGFKLAEWSKSEEKFNSISGEMKANRQQLQNQLAKLKGNHTMYGYIVNLLSGFGICCLLAFISPEMELNFSSIFDHSADLKPLYVDGGSSALFIRKNDSWQDIKAAATS